MSYGKKNKKNPWEARINKLKIKAHSMLGRAEQILLTTNIY